jgi:hypothetical protein
MLKYVNVTLGEPKRTCGCPLREVRPQLAVFQHALRVVAAERDEVQVPLREREDLRLRFLDDADLDAADLRQRLAAHVAHQFLLRCVGVFREADRAVIRVGLENHARRAPPFLEAVRSCPHRLAHHIGAGGFDRFARNGHRRQTGEPLEQRVIGLRQAHHDGVAIRCLQPFDAGIVVEFRVRLARRIDDGTRPDDEVGQRGVATLAQIRVERPLDRVNIVGGDEFPRLALEDGVVREQDSLLHAHRPRAAVVGDRGHRLRGVRNHLRARGQVLELVHRLEDRSRDARRVEIRSLLGIEARDVVHRDAQHLFHVRAGIGRARQQGEQRQRDGHDPQHVEWPDHHEYP